MKTQQPLDPMFEIAAWSLVEAELRDVGATRITLNHGMGEPVSIEYSKADDRGGASLAMVFARTIADAVQKVRKFR